MFIFLALWLTLGCPFIFHVARLPEFPHREVSSLSGTTGEQPLECSQALTNGNNTFLHDALMRGLYNTSISISYWHGSYLSSCVLDGGHWSLRWERGWYSHSRVILTTHHHYQKGCRASYQGTHTLVHMTREPGIDIWLPGFFNETPAIIVLTEFTVCNNWRE